MRRAAAVLAPLLVLICAALASTACPARPPAPQARLNLVVVTVDSLRADHLGCAGFAGAQTPAIDALAARGARFTSAWTPVPEATPAAASIMTGLYPAAHGLRSAYPSPFGARTQLADAATTLAETLKAQGYATGASVAALLMHERHGLAQGFDAYLTSFADAPRPSQILEAGYPAQRVVDAALEYLEGAKGGPFFLWVNFQDPHFFYAPPEPFATRFAGALYDGEIAYVDRELGRLLERMKGWGLEERTVVVLAGTNGEGLGDRGELYHGVTLQAATTRVPLIIAAPGASGLKAGSRIDATASLIDVAPTALALLGLPAMMGIDGVSLASGRAPERTIYLEASLGESLMGWPRARGAVDATLKLAVMGGAVALYDIQADPAEANDLAASRPADASRLRALVDAREREAAPVLEPAAVALIREAGFREAAAHRDTPGGDQISIANNALKGDRSLRRRQLQAAWLLFESVLKEDRDNYIGLLNSALLSGSRRDNAGARRMLERAQALYPGASEVYHQLGHLTMAEQAAQGAGASRDSDAAQRLFEVASVLDPGNEEAHYDAACGYSVRGDTERALEALQRAVTAGFRDFKWMAGDGDLDPIRSDPRFNTITGGKAAKASAEPTPSAPAAAPR